MRPTSLQRRRIYSVTGPHSVPEVRSISHLATPRGCSAAIRARHAASGTSQGATCSPSPHARFPPGAIRHGERIGDWMPGTGRGRHGRRLRSRCRPRDGHRRWGSGGLVAIAADSFRTRQASPDHRLAVQPSHRQLVAAPAQPLLVHRAPVRTSVARPGLELGLKPFSRKTDDIREGTVDPFDDPVAVFLDGVGPGLVERIDPFQIGADLPRVQGTERDVG
jgi:hypothetical protein